MKETDTLVHLRISGEEIVTTENHPFYVDGEGWVTAGELTEEDYVLDSEGRRLQVEEKYVEKLEESVKVYNFEVEEYHTYYVGDAGILVHNKCWDDVSPVSNKNPLQDIEYTSKVKAQMELGDYHSFTKSVEAFGDSGKISSLTGGDEIVRTKVEIAGSYKGKTRVFEYIIEPDGKTVNHRLFKPYD